MEEDKDESPSSMETVKSNSTCISGSSNLVSEGFEVSVLIAIGIVVVGEMSRLIYGTGPYAAFILLR